MMTPDKEKEYGPRPKLTRLMSASEGAQIQRHSSGETDVLNPQDFMDDNKSGFSAGKEDKINMNPNQKFSDSGDNTKNIYFHLVRDKQTAWYTYIYIKIESK